MAVQPLNIGTLVKLPDYIGEGNDLFGGVERRKVVVANSPVSGRRVRTMLYTIRLTDGTMIEKYRWELVVMK